MTTIVTRAGKGSPLTNNEVDANFVNLNDAKIETLTSTDSSVTITGTGSSRDLSVPTNPDAVSGPASSTDNAIARFDLTTGKLIQNSVVTVSDTGAVAGVVSVTDPNFIDFNTAYTTPVTEGQLGWDGTYNSLAIGMIGGNVIQHIGEDTYLYVKASSAITKGQVCMFTGSVGASGVVTAAPATGITNGQVIIGVAAESIANNGFGLIQTYGELRSVNTAAFADGDILYYDSAVTGGFTATYPSSGPVVTVAAVVNGGSAGGGVIQIRVSVTQRITASTGISVSQTSSGSTITNTAPDQTVAISSGSGISVTGTYPNFTVAATSSGATISDDTTTNATRYPLYAAATSGTASTIYVSSTKYTFNPSTGALTVAGDVTSSSDERVKTNWRSLPVDFLTQLASVKSGIYDRSDLEATQAGVSAQSLQQVLPQTVTTDPDGMLSVAYGNAALVAAIELAKEVTALRKELNELKGKG